MDTGQLITFILGGGGILGFIGTIIQVRKNASTANAKTEVEAESQRSADWDKFMSGVQKHLDFQDRQIEKLRSEVTDLKDSRRYDQEHIRLLQRQIWAQLPPPPLKPGDPWPEDEVGG